MNKKKTTKTRAGTKVQPKTTRVAVKPKAATKRPAALAMTAAVSAATAAQSFTGVFRFPGEYAFLEKFNIPDYALLQENDPFTGKFSKLSAENTCIGLQSRHQDGDPANLSGKIVTCDVEGRQTPVLFLFD
jgi:hypothetical protein